MQKGTELTDPYITSNGRAAQSVVEKTSGTDYIHKLPSEKSTNKGKCVVYGVLILLFLYAFGSFMYALGAERMKIQSMIPYTDTIQQPNGEKLVILREAIGLEGLWLKILPKGEELFVDSQASLEAYQGYRYYGMACGPSEDVLVITPQGKVFIGEPEHH